MEICNQRQRDRRREREREEEEEEEEEGREGERERERERERGGERERKGLASRRRFTVINSEVLILKFCFHRIAELITKKDRG